MAKINEITRGMGDVSLEAKVIDISEKRQVQTKYGARSVADATIEDDTGQISLTLWEGQIDSIPVGSTIVLSGAYVNEFRGKLQLNVPKNGQLEVKDASAEE